MAVIYTFSVVQNALANFNPPGTNICSCWKPYLLANTVSAQARKRGQKMVVKLKTYSIQRPLLGVQRQTNPIVQSRSKVIRLPKPRLEQEVAVVLQPDAGLQEGLERIALPVQAVDDLGACGGMVRTDQRWQ